jgi:hypothetical protein
MLKKLENRFHKIHFWKTLFEENHFSQTFEGHTQRVLMYLFTRHFEMGARLSKHLEEAKSLEWNKTFQNPFFFGSHFYFKQEFILAELWILKSLY